MLLGRLIAKPRYSRSVHLVHGVKNFNYLATVQRNASVSSTLNTIKDNPGSKKEVTRLGRGQASGKGRTAGRGLKGQRSRTSGNGNNGFEGGQTPHWKSVRKYGFTNAKFARTFSLVNLDRLQEWIQTGRIDPKKVIDERVLIKSGAAGKLRRSQVGVKLLGNGSELFKQKITILVTQASDSAIDAVKKNGGSIDLVHHNKVGMRNFLRAEDPDQVTVYYAPPPPSINRKLKRPMTQPAQSPAWIEKQKKLSELQRVTE